MNDDIERMVVPAEISQNVLARQDVLYSPLKAMDDMAVLDSTDGGEISDASTAASQSYFLSSPSSSGVFEYSSDFSPIHTLSNDCTESDYSECIVKPNDITIGSYIIYLQPDASTSGNEFAKMLNTSRSFIQSEYPGPDDSFLYPLHVTLTSFFDVRATTTNSITAAALPEHLTLRDFTRSNSAFNFLHDYTWKKQSSSEDESTLGYKACDGFSGHVAESPDIVSLHSLSSSCSTGWFPMSGCCTGHSEDFSAADDTTRDRLLLGTCVENRLTEAVRKFIKKNVPGTTMNELEKGVIELSVPAFDFPAADDPLHVRSGRIIIPWDLEWLVPGHLPTQEDPNGQVDNANKATTTNNESGQLEMLQQLCTEIENSLKEKLLEQPDGMIFYPVKTRDGGENTSSLSGTHPVTSHSTTPGISRKRRMHMTLFNREDLSLEKRDEVFQYLKKVLEKAQEGSVRWNLCVKQILSWGCSTEGESHRFRDVLVVKNFANSSKAPSINLAI